MSFQNLEIRREDRVGWIEYRRSPVNAINWDMLREIPAALMQLLDDSQGRSQAVRGFRAGWSVSSCSPAPSRNISASGPTRRLLSAKSPCS
jgi:enoyl-CoA hydratase/carnithine racemase